MAWPRPAAADPTMDPSPTYAKAAEPAAEVIEMATIRPAKVERTTVHMRSPILHAQPGPSSRPGRRTVRAGPPIGWLVRASVAVVAVALPAIPILFFDWRWALIVAGTLAIGWLVRHTSHRAPFGFGDGFVAFHSDLGWPQGIQEDDDVHWSWRTNDPDRSPGRTVAGIR